jgi:hypothetical protein
MELQFVKQGSRYIAEFQTTGDFNLHIEREESGYLYVNQRTPDTGKYDSIKGTSFNYGDSVVDVDFSFLVYPKQIQVVSKVLPTMAVVTASEGGEVGYSETQILETLNTPL